LAEQDGVVKALYFYGDLLKPIYFVGNHAFSSLLRDFGKMSGYADRWETALDDNEDPTERGLQSSEVPDHDRILERFREALRCPDDQWSLERDHRRRLWKAIEEMGLRVLSIYSSTEPQKRPQSSES